MDELDDLLNSFASETPAKKGPASKGGDLDALLAGDKLEDRYKDRRNTRRVNRERPSGTGDDLDALIDSLDADAKKPAHAPAPAGDALATADTLLRDLAPPSDASDDVDALLASLEPPQAAPKAQPAAARGAPPAQPSVDDDIDALLSGLDAAEPRRPAGRAAPPSRYADGDVNDALAALDLNDAPAARAGAGSGKGSVDDDLGELLSTFKAGERPVAAAGGACAGCRRPLGGDANVQAVGQRRWHAACFVCGSCGAAVGGSGAPYYAVEGAPQCQKCYQAQFLPRCAACDKSITGQCIQGLGKKYHVACFNCQSCMAPLGTQQFFERDGQPFCAGCYQGIFSYRCHGCQQPIRGDAVNALGNYFHPECFSCTTCKRPFTNTPFFEHGGRPYCEQHFHQMRGALCKACQRPVGGRVVEAMGGVWHPEHWLCSFCMNALAGQSFSEREGKPYCPACFHQLFK